MLQIINISEARNHLAGLVAQVKQTGQSVVIVQDSNPSVIVSPYNSATMHQEEYLDKLLAVEGDWFSDNEFRKNRQEMSKRLSKTR